jgi:acetyltransferase-like isoleucine patch superfamily enzyme
VTVKIEKGDYNHIHESVQFIPLCDEPGPVTIGDCNTIHENVKIVVGKEGFRMGDWNTIHNGVFIMDDVTIGHNCWIGQGSHLDGRGKLTVGNGVSIAYFSHIWSHVARGELLDGCILFGSEPTVIEDDVWMVGNNIHVSPGARLGKKSIILSHAVVTEHTHPEWTYAGVPAKRVRSRNYWKELSYKNKWDMLRIWVKEFTVQYNESKAEEKYHLKIEFGLSSIMVVNKATGECLYFALEDPEVAFGPKTTVFDIRNKTYTKKLTLLEREFYAYMKDYKARFLPV